MTPEEFKKAVRAIANDNCIACGADPEEQTAHEIAGVTRCLDCGAIYGECSLAESFSLVSTRWATPEEETAGRVAGRINYFDLCSPEADGGKDFRRHGWYDERTRSTVQVG